MDQLIHTSNLYYNVPLAEAAKKLVEASGMDKVFFTNSGTEAIEGAIKAAQKVCLLARMAARIMRSSRCAIPFTAEASVHFP